MDNEFINSLFKLRSTDKTNAKIQREKKKGKVTS